MENFPIVLALLRASVRDKSSAVIQHAERLQEALQKAGALDQAQALSEVLNETRKPSSGKLVPSRVVKSRVVSMGEMMTPNTAPPVDKETSAPLAEIFFPEQLAELAAPILNERLVRATGHLQVLWTSWYRQNTSCLVGSLKAGPAGSPCAAGWPDEFVFGYHRQEHSNTV